MISPVKIALIASGSGTDANAILEAQDAGKLIDGEVSLLIVTKENVPAIEVGKRHGIDVAVIPHQKLRRDFAGEIGKVLMEKEIDLIFLVGCIHKVPVYNEIPAYNIHPADIEKFGGKGMYGIKVHEKVLEEIRSRLGNDRKAGIKRWFTYITVHEVDNEYDHGPIFLRCAVEVDPEIDTPETLQKKVLQFEWMLLPTALNMAIRRIRMKKAI